jgi:hypothetical protein
MFPDHEEHEIDDLLRDRRAPHALTQLAAIPLGGNQFSMPAQDRFGPHNGGDFLQCLATRYLSYDGQTPALVITEQDPFLAKLLIEHPILSSQILDYILLVAIDPTGEDHQEQLPRF